MSTMISLARAVAFFALSSACVVACAPAEDEPATGSRDSLTTDACKEKSCGDVCGFDSTLQLTKMCNAQKECVAAADGVACGGDDDACADHACGDVCGFDEDLNLTKMCNAQKECVTAADGVACGR